MGGAPHPFFAGKALGTRLARFARVYAEKDSRLDLKGQNWTDSKNLRWVRFSSKVILILTGTKYQNTEYELLLLGRDEELTLK